MIYYEIKELTITLPQQHPGFGKLIDPNPANDRKSGDGDDTIVDSIPALWSKLSEPDVVATEEGESARPIWALFAVIPQNMLMRRCSSEGA